MIEKKHLQKIMSEYCELLEQYEPILSTMSIEDIKRLIGEVKIFWHRHKNYVNYFLSNITKEDEVVYLADSIKLGIKENGHLEFLSSGKVRLVNEPILKMSAFYSMPEKDINFDYFNTYLKESISEQLVMLREYKNDFYIFPIEPIMQSEKKEYLQLLGNLSDSLIFSLFKNEYSSETAFQEQCDTYESIEEQLIDELKKHIFFCSLEESNLPLRQKCENYISANRKSIILLGDLSEPQVFLMAVRQYIMQALGIVNYAMNCNILPFIRNDITFNYFTLIVNSTEMKDFSHDDYLYVYITYVIQKYIDFAQIGYDYIKMHLGKGELIHYIKSQIGEQEDAPPSPNKIVELAEKYVEKIIA